LNSSYSSDQKGDEITESGGRLSDGKVINKHFENASHFLIFGVMGVKYNS
jgi:hypothetical protein